MLRRPLSVPVARVGRSVPEGRCALPALRPLLLIAVGASLSAPALAASTAVPIPKIGVPQPCGSGTCGGRSFLAGQGKLVNGATTAVNAPVWDPNSHTLTVTQNADKVILNWGGFNIDAGNTVRFVQPSTTSVAMNKVWDANPTQIFGQLQANGTVYLLNQNGIVFGRGSQVSVGGLLASTLNLQNSDFLASILNPAQQGNAVLSAIDDSGNRYTPAAVTVQAGASIATPKGTSGQIILAGGTVSNAGTLSSPDGQILLLAGDSVWLAPSDPANTSVRGLVAAVDDTTGGSTPGVATNTGTLQADRGNITMAALTVNQQGIVHATTSVNFNGSIFLTAGNYGGGGPALQAGKFVDNVPSQQATQVTPGGDPPTHGGTLTLGEGSRTEVRPDLSDTATAIDAQTQQQGVINLQALNITVGAQATVAAPSGAVNMVARQDLSSDRPATPAISGQGNASTAAGSIVIDDGALIDVSGTQDVQLSVTRNFVQAQLRGNELADSPLQRNGFLYTRNVTVDIRGVDSNGNIPLANVSGYVNSIGRTVGERTTTGGTVTLDAGSTVVLHQGATVDLSGGYLDYQGGYASTTRLLASNGRVYDVMNAPANLEYVGFANGFTQTSSKWGTSQTWLGLKAAQRSWVPGYLEGRNAGTLEIYATGTALDGTVLARTVRGPNQRTPQSMVSASELANTLDLSAQQYREAPLGGTVSLGDPVYVRAQDVVLTHTVTPLDSSLSDASLASTGLPGVRALSTELPMDSLVAGGVATINAYAQDSITLAAGPSYVLPAGGSLNLHANTVQLDAGVTAHGGSLIAQAQDPALPVGPALTRLPTVSVAPGVVLDVSGQWVNDSARQTNADLTALKDVKGGSISLSAADRAAGNGGLTLGAGSVLDVSGGAWLNRSGVLYAGAAGSISLAAAGAPGIDSSLGFSSGATYLGYGFAGGGRLSLTAPLIRVGQGPAATGETLFDPGFFQQGGFASISLNAELDLTVDPHTAISAVAQNRIPLLQDALLPTGTALSSVATVATLPDTQRANPMTLALNSLQGGVVAIGAGASLTTDPGGAISLQDSGGRIYVDGTLSAPSGSISLTVRSPSLVTTYDPTQSIWLGPQGRLLAVEASEVQTAANGVRSGGLINDGGNSVTLNAQRGTVVTEAGSLIDVSATTATVDLPQSRSGQRVSTTLQGNAGTVSITGADALHLDGDLEGQAGGTQGKGGNFNLTLNYLQGYDLNNTPNLPGNHVEQLTLFGTAIPALPPGLDPGQPLPASSFGLGALSLPTLTHGGFDAVALTSLSKIVFGDSFDFQVGRSLSLNAPVIGAVPGAVTTLAAPVVTLSGPGLPGAAPTAAATTGSHLDVEAQQLDVRGNVALTGYDSTLLHSQGDLRLIGASEVSNGLQGSLEVAGPLTLDAAQVYPSTLSQFTITDSTRLQVLNSQGATATAPLSAAGSLTLQAPDIQQDGVLRAPFGVLDLQAGNSLTLGAQSITSVSGKGLDVPFGNTANGQQAYYTFGSGRNAFLSLSGAPAKQITLNGNTVTVASGAGIDLSGGGDLMAFESVIGPGGSRDILNNSSTYAILPGTAYANAYAPVDPLYASSGASVTVGSQVYLSGGPFAPGWYTLLPSHYALLPGAYAVKLLSTPNPVTGKPQLQADGTALVSASNLLSTVDPSPGQTVRQPDGSYLVAGKTGVLGTDTLASRWSTWEVLPSSAIHAYSELDVSQASTFFPAAAAKNNTTAGVLPGDAGTLLLAAGQTLNLPSSTGTFDFAGGPGGRGGELDLSAQHLAVVSDTAAASGLPADTLVVAASTLDGFQAERLVLGGTIDAASGTLTVGASTLTVANDAAHALTAPDLILAATQSVTVEGGSALSTRSSQSGAAPISLQTSGDSAVLRLTDGALPGLTRAAVSGAQAVLDLPAAASGSHPTTLSAGGSITLDSAASVTLDPSTVLTTSALRVDASTINLGAVQGISSGASLTQATLAQARTLVLQARQGVNLYGNTTIGSADAPLGSLTLDAPVITSTDGGATSLVARNVTLEDSVGSQVSASAGSGSLTLHAVEASDGTGGNLLLGTGQQSFSGFQTVALTADHATTILAGGGTPVAAAGKATQSASSTALATPVVPGGLAVAGTLALSTPLLQSSPDSRYTLASSGTLAVTGTGAAAPAAVAGAGGRLTLSGSAVTVDTQVSAIGGAVTVAASQGDLTLGSHASIDAAGYAAGFQGASSVTDAGSVSLVASQGSVILAAGSRLSVDAVAGGNAGAISLSAPQGHLALGGTLSGSAAAGQTAGSLAVDVGTLDNTTLAALASAQGANAGDFVESFDLRVRQGDLTLGTGIALSAHQITVAADQGSLTVAGTLSADADSHHADAGSLSLWAGHDLSLLGALSASAPSGAAGTLSLGLAANSSGTLSAASGSSIGLSGATGAGTLTLIAPQTAGGMALGSFQASGLETNATTGSGPAIQLEAMQYYSGQNLTDPAFLGAGGTVATAAAAFAANAAAVQAQLPASAAGRTGLFVGVQVDNPQQQGDGTVIAAGTALDLAHLHFAGLGVNPGTLVVRSGGDLSLGGTLNDGFASVAAARGSGLPATIQAQSAAAGGQWSYDLVAGADLSSANPLAVSADPAAGALHLQATSLVRTGSGSIHLASAGDVTFGYQDPATSASVYTAGVLSPFPSTLAPFQNGAVHVQRSAASGSQVQYIQQFTYQGGDVTVDAGGNVQGSGSTQQVDDWLFRSATIGVVRVGTDANGNGIFANLFTNPVPGTGRGAQDQTSWWVEFDRFHMDLGALGGGNLSVHAKGDVNDLSAAAPSNGRLGGGIFISPTAPASDQAFSPTNLYIDRGGDLSIVAGGDIRGGSYYVASGSGLLRAGGGILGSASQAGGYAPVLALGNSSFKLVAGNSVDLSTAYDPFLVAQALPNVVGGSVDQSGQLSYPAANDGDPFTTYFTGYYSYDPASASFTTHSSLNVLSEGGDVSLGKGLNSLTEAWQQHGIVTSSNGTGGFSILPATVTLVAQQGNVLIDQAFNLAPAPAGNLTILAGQSVDLRQTVAGNPSSLALSDGNPQLLVNPSHPVSAALGGQTTAGVLDGFSQADSNALHAGDTAPVLVEAQAGSILGTAGGGSDSLLAAPKPIQLQAGQDISGVTVLAQNLQSTDVTSLSAGRDIVLSPLGEVPANQQDFTTIEVDGPGRLLLQAGRNVNLGSAEGLITRSNLTAAQTTGASVGVYAGLGRCAGGPCQPDFATFAQDYINPASSIATSHGNTTLLQDYMDGLRDDGVKLDANAAWTAFQALTPAQQSLLIEQVLANELHLNALDHNLHGASFAAGYQAIGTLFPGSVIDTPTGKAVDFADPPTVVAGAGSQRLALAANPDQSGNVSLVYSQIRTLTGGDIGVFTPNGGVDVGLANQPPGTPKKGPDQLGIVTQDSGAVRGVAAQDINVNASRIFSVGGGDIALWSSFGNIDAGKGAKSVQVVPPPTYSFNASGQLVITVTGATSGSGIGALLTGPGQVPGNVDLIAPVGIVDAGDAGIRAAGNLNIAAATVLNAANIQVGGSSTGVPAVEAVTVSAPAPTTSANSNAGQSTEEANKRLAEGAQRADQLQNQFKPTIVTVEVSADDEGTASERCAQPPCKGQRTTR